VGADLVWEKLPRATAIAGCPDKALADDCLLAGGDDYELVFTAPTSRRAEIAAAGKNSQFRFPYRVAVPGIPW